MTFFKPIFVAAFAAILLGSAWPKENPSATCNGLGQANLFLERSAMATVAKEVRGVKAGQQYGQRTVLGCPFSVGKSNASKQLWMVVCECNCGVVAAVHLNILKAGAADTCVSCSNRERALTHGETGSQLYQIWSGMISRCTLPSNPGFKYYGARGISVCHAWLLSYEVFRDWSRLNGYQPGLSIDRIDNDGSYEPSNCQWITISANSAKQWADRRAKSLS